MARARPRSHPADLDREAADLMASCAADPLRFVLAAFPWGEGELAGHDGPDRWQRDILAAVRDRRLATAEALRVRAIANGTDTTSTALPAPPPYPAGT